MRAGRLRLIPVAELERWISENAARLGDRRLAHDCRHTFASLMIAAGVNAKALSEFMGHASIKITMDLYGHLLPGSEAEAAVRLHAYLTAAGADAARTADAEPRVPGSFRRGGVVSSMESVGRAPNG